MLALPVTTFAPPVSTALGGAIDLPFAAACIASFLIAALVGSALGLLREATSPSPTVRSDEPWQPKSVEYVAGDYPHRHAA